MAMTDRELLAKAFCDAYAREYDEELANSNESPECSRAHYRKMSKILGFKVMPKSKGLTLQKKIAIAIVAAALLLVGCTAVIFRNEIKSMIESVFDTFIKSTYDEERDGYGTTITEHYKLTYVPDGYELVKENKTPIQIVYKYRDKTNNILIFEQNVICGTGYTFDTEEGYTQSLNVYGRKIYFGVSGEYHKYIWNDRTYAFRITSKNKIKYEELERIIEGLLPQ